MTILKTKDYSKFTVHASNGIYDEANYKKLLNSMSKKNMLEFRPVIVNSDFEVIDGKHRLRAAIELGIDLYYQVKQDAVSSDILDLQLQRRLKSQDFFHFYVSEGFEEYIKLKNWMVKNKVELSTAICFFVSRSTSLLNTRASSTGKTFESFKQGKFIFPNEEQIRKINEQFSSYLLIIERIFSLSACRTSKNFCNNKNFIKALISFVKKEGVSIDLFLNKLELRFDMLRRCVATESYYNMFVEIYNYKNKNPLEKFELQD